MSKLYHFGDSWGTCDKSEKIFTHYLAKKLGAKLVHLCKGGLSNRSIFEKIIDSHPYEKDDILIVNWSYFERFDTVDISENFYTNIYGTWTNEKYKIIPSSYDSLNKHKVWLLNGFLNFKSHENYKLFSLINKFFNGIEKMGIKSYHIFIAKPFEFIDLNQIQFDDCEDYDAWLSKNEYDKQQSEHYTWNVQEIISEYLYKKIVNEKI